MEVREQGSDPFGDLIADAAHGLEVLTGGSSSSQSS